MTVVGAALGIAATCAALAVLAAVVLPTDPRVVWVGVLSAASAAAGGVAGDRRAHRQRDVHGRSIPICSPSAAFASRSTR